MKLIKDLKPWVYMARLARKDPTPGSYLTGDTEWNFYRDRLKKLVNRYRYVLTTDIVSFFASIPLERLLEHVETRAGLTDVSKRLISLVEDWGRIPGRSGIPQRFLSSSVLANMYLRPVDDVLHSFARSTHKFIPGRATRWMDDIWLFGDNESRLRRAQVELEEAMRSLGLNMNLAKTQLLEGEDAESEVQQREHSAVDVGLARVEPDYAPLDMMISAIVGAPEEADRTAVRFVTRRMRLTRRFDRVGEFVDVAPRMPHAADVLARLFRESEVWRDLSDWFVSYTRSDWAVSEWSIAQLGTMFPGGELPAPSVIDFFNEELVSNASLPLTALCAQRLSDWDSDTARIVIRERALRVDNALLRRVLALAAIAAGEDNQFVRELLSQFEENLVTYEMVKQKRFRRFRVVADFEGA